MHDALFSPIAVMLSHLVASIIYKTICYWYGENLSTHPYSSFTSAKRIANRSLMSLAMKCMYAATTAAGTKTIVPSIC
jgi:hypothetical protein